MLIYILVAIIGAASSVISQIGDLAASAIKRNYDIKLKKHIDAGSELYLEKQETYAGASGPVALPLVLYCTIFIPIRS